MNSIFEKIKKWLKKQWDKIFNDKEENPNPPGPNPPEPPIPSDDIPKDTSFLHTNIRDWPIVTNLSVSQNGGKITLNYDKAKVWKSIDGVNANPWVIVKWNDGKIYAATWEWLRFGQTLKNMNGKSWGDHIKRKPLDKWEPSKGEKIGFMVSGLARDSKRNSKERSNVCWITWK